MSARIDVADCIAWAEAYDGPPFHALLCDPPYELGFMGRAWDRSGIAFNPDTWRALARVLHPGAFGMAFASSRGWHRLAVAIEDAGLIIHPSIFGWAQGSGFPKATRVVVKCECERTLPKAQHDVPELRQTDISEAGQNGVSDRCDVLDGLQEQVVQEHGESSDEGSAGRPESGMERRGDVSETSRQLRVGKVCAVPARASTDGADGRIHHGASPCNGDVVRPSLDAGGDGAPCGPRPVEQPAVQPGIVADKCGPQEGRGGAVCSRCGKPLESSTVWLGHRYGLQALKPALEPIIVFQKPYAGRPVDSITATGAGALNVDGGRVPTGESGRPHISPDGNGDSAGVYGNGLHGSSHLGTFHAGRWPANLVLCHTPDCVRVGERRVATGTTYEQPAGTVEGRGIYGPRSLGRVTGYADADGLETVAAYACAPGCPVAALGAQSGELKPRANRGPSTSKVDDFGFTTPHACGIECNHADTGTAARFFHNPDYALDIAERLAAAEPVRYVAKASRRERNAGCEGLEERAMNWSSGEQSPGTFQSDGTNRAARNPHPTVKPLALAQHLATLLLPPDAYAPRRIFIPFLGSGSEAIGAMLAGWDEVVGVELSEEYADIGRARLAWWEANRDKAPAAGAMRGKPAHSRGGRSMNGGRFAAEDAIKREDPAATQAALPLAEAGS